LARKSMAADVAIAMSSSQSLAVTATSAGPEKSKSWRATTEVTVLLIFAPENVKFSGDPMLGVRVTAKVVTVSTPFGTLTVRARTVSDFEHDVSIGLALRGRRRSSAGERRTDLLMARHHNDRHSGCKDFQWRIVATHSRATVATAFAVDPQPGVGVWLVGAKGHSHEGLHPSDNGIVVPTSPLFPARTAL